MPSQAAFSKTFLADTSLLAEHCNKLNTIAEENVAENQPSFLHMTFELKGGAKQQREQLLNEALVLAKAATNVAICQIAEIYGLDRSYARELPAITVADPITTAHNKYLYSMDYQDHYYFGLEIGLPPQTSSYFTEQGDPHYGEPRGPCISYYTPTLAPVFIVEESLHFLLYHYCIRKNGREEFQQFVNNTADGDKNIALPNEDFSWLKNDSKLTASLGQQEHLAYHILQEAVAYFTCSLFKDFPPIDFAAVGKWKATYGSGETAQQVFDVYISDGLPGIRDLFNCWRQKERTTPILCHLEQADRDIGLAIHFIGYKLGANLAEKLLLKEENIIKRVGQIAFGPSGNILSQLNDLNHLAVDSQ